MREIKFRAWDKVYNQMSPEFVLFGEFTLLGAVHDWQWEITGKGPGEIENYSSLLRLNDLEVMQYTGLKDKNGKDIYEGDILNGKNQVLKVVKWDTKRASFVYIEQFKPKTVRVSFAQMYDKFRSVFYKNGLLLNHEVIGNIYENPELL